MIKVARIPSFPCVDDLLQNQLSRSILLTR